MKKWLKKILPQSVNAFNREMQILKDYISIQNAEIIKLQKNNYVLISKLQKEQKMFSEKLDELTNKQDILAAQQSDLVKNQDELKLIAEMRTRSSPNTDIEKQLWALAGRQTAEYVASNMCMCLTFLNPDKLREYSVLKAGEGLYLEFGVFSGKSINQIAELKPNNIIYGFDSFEGLPETWRTGFEAGKFSMEGLPEVKENVKLLKGWFVDSLPAFLAEHPEKCAFIHVDCDLYSSTKTIFDLLEDRIVSGTILLFDEYFNYPGWQNHEFRAFMEFINKTSLKYEYLAYVKNFEQVAVIVL